MMAIRQFIIPWLFLMVLVSSFATSSHALVNYEVGQLELNGVLLLQDAQDSKAYYYLPTAPRVSTRSDGGLELSVIKFIDPEGETSGGLFHMLVTYTLPPDELEALREALKQEQLGSRLLGPVPLRQEEEGSFSIISGTLSDKGFTRNIISSGRAPVTPGAKAAVAATLTPYGATLLWESLNRPTSDVSVALRTYYEAAMPSFRARIHADVSTVYTHFSNIFNKQESYDKKQVRDVVDELVRSGDIEVEVLDRLPEDKANQAMQSLVDLVTNKLADIIFDTKTGFTAVPTKEKAVSKGQLAGRQKKGWLAKLFTSTGNQQYVTDNQLVIKDRKDINRAVFSINLTRRSVVKVSVDTAGNIAGLYGAFKNNQDMFRVVNLADPAFQKRDLYFRIDGDYTGAFEKILNFAGISVRKTYRDHADATGELLFTREDIRDGKLGKVWHYARLGEKGDSWLNYDYRTAWSIKGQHKVRQPKEEGAWLSGSDPVITLAPPLQRLDLEVDADRFLFEDAGIRSATLEVQYRVFGKKQTERLLVMRATDAESVSNAILFHDPRSKIEYRVNWYSAREQPVKGEWQILDGSYIMLAPPQ